MTSNWEDELMRRLSPPRVLHVKRNTYTGKAWHMPGNLNRASLYLPEQWRLWIVEAAERREVAQASYMRRAMAPLLGKDLHLSVMDVLAESPSVKSNIRKGIYPGGVADDGTGIEQWCPHPDCDGSHLRLPWA